MSLMPAFAPVAATAYRLDLAAADGVTFSLRTGSAITGADSIAWRPSGGRFFAAEQDNGSTGILAYYNCTGDSISGATFGGDIALGENRSYDSIAFNSAGTRVFISALTSVYTFSLSTAFGGSATELRSDSLGTGSVTSIFFNDNGTALFYVRIGALRRRTLSSAYDLSTMGSESTVIASVAGRVSVARGGTRLLVVNDTTIEEYGGDAYNFASHTLRETYDTGGTPEHATYSPNGRKLQTLNAFTVTQYSTAS